MFAQWDNDVIIVTSVPNPQAAVDTIAKGTPVFVGNGVYTFHLTIIRKGIVQERRCNGAFVSELDTSVSGTVIFIDQILAEQQGQIIKLPAKKYLVR
jgi:hypothetical protein